MNKFLYILIILIITSGCSKITEQARLDRFEEKLKKKEYNLSQKLSKNIEMREKNISSIKEDIKFLKTKIKSSKNQSDVKIKESYKRYAKNLKSQGEVQLVHYEIEMLKLENPERKKKT